MAEANLAALAWSFRSSTAYALWDKLVDQFALGGDALERFADARNRVRIRETKHPSYQALLEREFLMVLMLADCVWSDYRRLRDAITTNEKTRQMHLECNLETDYIAGDERGSDPRGSLLRRLLARISNGRIRTCFHEPGDHSPSLLLADNLAGMLDAVLTKKSHSLCEIFWQTNFAHTLSWQITQPDFRALNGLELLKPKDPATTAAGSG